MINLRFDFGEKFKLYGIGQGIDQPPPRLTLVGQAERDVPEELLRRKFIPIHREGVSGMRGHSHCEEWHSHDAAAEDRRKPISYLRL